MQIDSEENGEIDEGLYSRQLYVVLLCCTFILSNTNLSYLDTFLVLRL